MIIGLGATSGGLGYLYIITNDRLTSRDAAEEAASRQHESIVAGLQKTLGEKDGVIFTLQSETEALRNQLASTTEEAARIKEAQEAEREAIGKFVVDVQKVQNTDAELLKKYSKNYFLNENYKPSSLSTIPAEWQTSKKSPIEYLGPALPFIVKMFNAAESDGINLRVVSGFRSFEDQRDLKSAYRSSFGAGANKFSADQGYSEHQLGTAVDLSTKELDTSYTSIANSSAYKWLQDNAYKYGYILSYPKGNAYYMYEPWHWRFVGVELATELHDRKINFYEMDQREIDRYLGKLFDA
jgi:D-alanyl-D-alanine carboxypeptidase